MHIYRSDESWTNSNCVFCSVVCMVENQVRMKRSQIIYCFLEKKNKTTEKYICFLLHKMKIELAVYDLSNGLAAQMSQAILGQYIEGIWHTGVVVFNRGSLN